MIPVIIQSVLHTARRRAPRASSFQSERSMPRGRPLAPLVVMALAVAVLTLLLMQIEIG